ncbi:MAG: serine/threonine protein phosphatase [Firmicutes bacterium]|nr:serine/threonine protein phosphatase [Bacillota bacterium]
MHYVIGDVHGCYTEMIQLIDKINSVDSSAQFIFVGDFVDRGPSTKEVLDWCLSNITLTGKYQAVLGNHEDMLISWYYEKYEPYISSRSYFFSSIPSTNYDFANVIESNRLNASTIKKYIDWMEERPLSIDLEIEGQKYKIVHSWYWWDTNEETGRYVCLWLRNLKGNFKNDTIIVHGHTPTLDPEYLTDQDTCGRICYRHNSINVDGGCVFGKIFQGYNSALCAICLETKEEFYVETN